MKLSFYTCLKLLTHSACSPWRPYDVLHLNCFFCACKESPSPKSHSEVSLCRRSAERVISLKALCQGAINRFKGHPPAPNSPTHLHPFCNCPQMGAPLLACQVKRDAQPAMMLCLDEKTPTWWETLCLFFTGDKAFISSLKFQDTVTKIWWGANTVYHRWMLERLSSSITTSV